MDIQFKIFSDYGSHIARFFFDIDEIMAYHRTLDAVEMHVFDSGHQLLETHHEKCASLVSRFIFDVQTGYH